MPTRLLIALLLLAGASHAQPKKGDIVGAMNLIKPQVWACYEKYRVKGLANVQITILPNGTVGDVKLLGDFAKTPTGECVASAVKQARFEPFTGEPMVINYPFMFHQSNAQLH